MTEDEAKTKGVWQPVWEPRPGEQLVGGPVEYRGQVIIATTHGVYMLDPDIAVNGFVATRVTQ